MRDSGSPEEARSESFSDWLNGWADTVRDCSYYEILGVLEIADTDAVRQAYLDFARTFHPDSHPGITGEQTRTLERLFEQGVEAYKVLRDPTRRAEYDMALAKGFLRLQPGASRSAPPKVRSLDELCHTPSGRRAALQADALIGRGELSKALEQLKLALSHEGGSNPELEDRIDALDLALFAQGD